MAGSQEVWELQFCKKVIKIPEKSALKVSRLQASQFSARLSEFDRGLYIVSILYEEESLFPRFYWWPCGHKMCKKFSKLCQMYKREFFRQPVPSVRPRFCFISRCCLIFMYDREYLNNFIFFWQCECDVEYNYIFFHIVGHYMNYTGEYIRAQLAKYITKHMDAVWVVAGDFLKAKGLSRPICLIIANLAIELMSLPFTWFPDFAKNTLVSLPKTQFGLPDEIHRLKIARLS